MDKKLYYDESTVRWFSFFTVFWGFVGMLVGLYAALELAFWQLNFDLPYLTFGRLRPLHTNAVIFAFTGNGIFAGVYYSLQRVCKVRMFSDLLSKVHLWGWQLIIVLDAVLLLMGHTDGKEYAEPVWIVDIAITLIWVVFGINFFGTVAKRKVKHMYVAVWFYMSTIITVAMLHIVNNLAIPVNAFKSYPIYSGVQDALIQWWYGHNAVAFFLTTPILGLMYYFLPKALNRPVYSYRLSILHFWSLVFLYIWAGPHHLIYTALPDWCQTLGVVFSLMLIAPSWGGMINGILTFKGAWDKLRTDPIAKFFVVALTFYGMATFEGPMLSIKSVSALGHYTDWIVGHVHSGALGWVGFTIFAMLYWMVPRLYKTELYSQEMATKHFWLGTVGILIYVTSLWIAGVTQGLMWRAVTNEGELMYSFIETVHQLHPYYILRSLGGGIYLVGVVMMGYNLYKTAQRGKASPTLIESPKTKES